MKGVIIMQISESVRKKIIDELTYKKVVNQVTNNYTEKVQIEIDENSDIGVSADGTKYVKSAVVAYLRKNSSYWTDEEVNRVAKMFRYNENEKTLEVERDHRETRSVLADMSDDDMMAYINAKILERLDAIANNDAIKEYTVVPIMDKADGSIDANELKKVLNNYANMGWQLKSVFTNELGKNSVGASGLLTYQSVNATMDMTIIIFERSKRV